MAVLVGGTRVGVEVGLGPFNPEKTSANVKIMPNVNKAIEKGGILFCVLSLLRQLGQKFASSGRERLQAGHCFMVITLSKDLLSNAGNI